jgi:hypothetical protein
MIPRIRSQSANASYSGRVSGESETVERAVVELLLAGSAASASGMFWLSRISEHSHYAGALLGPMTVTAVGFGLPFVPRVTPVERSIPGRNCYKARCLVRCDVAQPSLPCVKGAARNGPRPDISGQYHPP